MEGNTADRDQVGERMQRFVSYGRTLKGDEKGEAQVFCDRLFQAFGHAGYKEAGATLEFRVKGPGKTTKFADLLWKPRLLLEMKKRGEKLQRHYTQAFEYWLELVPHRPKYVVLCNFDEFWIYDLDSQLNDPVDTVTLDDLPRRYPAFNFLFPVEKKPLFGNDRVAVTRAAADKVASVFNSLIAHDEDRERSQRFVLQCVVAMFSEDAELLPKGLFSGLLEECRAGGSSYDIIGALFRQMNNPNPARGGQFKDVRYFNGGIFQAIDPVELTKAEIELLNVAATEDWSKVQPPIFGTLFQSSMDKEERHAYGAHFTSEADIQKIVLPTIVRPWREQIEAATTLKELRQLLEELRRYRVLDPACGSGNFLYVAYRELKRLELTLMTKVHTDFGRRAQEAVGIRSLVSTKQFFGIDKNEFAVELAKVTLMLAKELAIAESRAWLDSVSQLDLPLEFDAPLPLENLDANIRCDDALFCDWPKVQAIIGNPPFLDARKTTIIHGLEYSKRLRKTYPDIPGRSDYCVHWFRRTHDELPSGARAGLVGTNSIRQNYSREGGLDYIVNNGGTITEAVASQVWSGDAAVHVSLVNWVKGQAKGPKKIFTQLGDNHDDPVKVDEVPLIPSSLSASLDVASAKRLEVNRSPKKCLEGQQPGHTGFCVNLETLRELIKDDPQWSDVVFPILNGDDFLSGTYHVEPSFLIDFGEREVFSAMNHKRLFEHLRQTVLPDWTRNAEEERRKTGKTTGEHQGRLQYWWLLKRRRGELIAAIDNLRRYIVCSAVTKRPIFEFISRDVRPSNALKAFLFEDDYSFGIIQSEAHWAWFKARCSTLKGDFRYTPDTVFDTFPWPQSPTIAHVKQVAAVAVALRSIRYQTMTNANFNLRELYRTLELPGKSALKDIQEELNLAVQSAYGMKQNEDALSFLLALNKELSQKEESHQPILGPGLPPIVKDPSPFISSDCIQCPNFNP